MIVNQHQLYESMIALHKEINEISIQFMNHPNEYIWMIGVDEWALELSWQDCGAFRKRHGVASMAYNI